METSERSKAMRWTSNPSLAILRGPLLVNPLLSPAPAEREPGGVGAAGRAGGAAERVGEPRAPAQELALLVRPHQTRSEA